MWSVSAEFAKRPFVQAGTRQHQLDDAGTTGSRAHDACLLREAACECVQVRAFDACARVCGQPESTSSSCDRVKMRRGRKQSVMSWAITHRRRAQTRSLTRLKAGKALECKWR